MSYIVEENPECCTILKYLVMIKNVFWNFVLESELFAVWLPISWQNSSSYLQDEIVIYLSVEDNVIRGVSHNLRSVLGYHWVRSSPPSSPLDSPSSQVCTLGFCVAVALDLFVRYFGFLCLCCFGTFCLLLWVSVTLLLWICVRYFGFLCPLLWVSVSVTLGLCDRYFGSLWPLLWLSVSVTLARCVRYFGSLCPLLWVSVSVTLGLCVCYFGSLWPLLWVSVSVTLALCVCYFGSLCLFLCFTGLYLGSLSLSLAL